MRRDARLHANVRRCSAIPVALRPPDGAAAEAPEERGQRAGGDRNMQIHDGMWTILDRMRDRNRARRLPRWPAVAAVLAAVAGNVSHTRADDVFPQAVNYVFTGQVAPADAPEVVDRKNCVVVVTDPRYKRYARYYLGRFKLDSARYNKRYSGSRAVYDLDVQGDDVILEYLAPDKSTVLQAYKSAQIPLPGDFDSTQKALKIVSDSCKAEGPKAPF